MNVKHTPGPWFIWKELAMEREGLDPEEISDELLYYGSFDIYAGTPKRITRASLSGCEHVCDLNTEFSDQSPEVALANARLIAAAPELLEALQQSERQLADAGHDGSQDDAACRALLIIRAAIAKATGGAA